MSRIRGSGVRPAQVVITSEAQRAEDALAAAIIARDAAIAAQSQAEAARDVAITQAGNAATSAIAADTARAAAVIAKNAAEAANTAAQAAMVASQTAQGLSEAARDASIAARNASQAAQAASEAARNAAQTAQTASEAARDISIAARDASIAARDVSITQAGNSAASATAANNSAVAAAASAAAAATFNPANFVAKAGDTMTGSLIAKDLVAQRAASGEWTYVVIDSDRTTGRSVIQWKGSNQAAWEAIRAGDDNFYFSRMNPATGAYVENAYSITNTNGLVWFAHRPIFGAYTPWDTGNFDPNTKASLTGAIFTGSVVVRSNPVHGRVEMVSGDTLAPGYVGFFDETGTRVGYIGYEPVANRLGMHTEGSFSGFSFNARPLFNNQTPWDTGNFDPATKANLSGATFTGSVTAKENLNITKNGLNWSWLTIDSDSAANSIVNFQADGYSNWQISRNATNRNLYTFRFDAAGNYISAAQYYDFTTGQSAFTVRPQWAGYTPWDTGNFDPNTKANLATAAFTGIISAPDIATISSLQFRNNSFGADLKNADWAHEATDTNFRVINDAYSGVVGNPIKINRSTGLVTLSNRPVFNGNTPWDTGNFTPNQMLVASGSVTTSTGNIELTLPAGYKTFRLVMRSLRPQVDGGYYCLQAKQSGGWFTGSGSYGWTQAYWIMGGAFSRWDHSSGGAVSTGFVFSSNTALAASTSNYSYVDIDPGMTGRTANFISHWMHGATGGNGNGYLNSLGRIEAVRIMMTTGNIGECYYELYGAL